MGSITQGCFTMNKLEDFFKKSHLFSFGFMIKRHTQKWGTPEEKNHVLEDLRAGKDKGGQHELTET